MRLGGGAACALAALLITARAQGGPASTRPALPIGELLASAGCRECHNPEGVASDTRLVFLSPGAPAAARNAAVEGLLALVDRDAPALSRLVRKPTRRLAHEGGLKIVPGSAEEEALVTWARDLAVTAPGRILEVLGAAGPSDGPVERVSLRRLTGLQYDNTVRDLLGDGPPPSRSFPPDELVDGFRNQVAGQSPSPALVEAWSLAAEQLAADAA